MVRHNAHPLRLARAGIDMNAQANNRPGTNTERVFRSHDRPTISVPELVAIQRGYLERLGAIVDQLSTTVRRPDALAPIINSPPQEVSTDASLGQWSVLTSKPFTGVGVHADAGRLVFDLRSPEGNVRMRLSRGELPVLLKTLIDAIAELTQVSE